MSLRGWILLALILGAVPPARGLTREFVDSYHVGLGNITTSEYGGGFADQGAPGLYSIGYLYRRESGLAFGYRTFLFPGSKIFLLSAGVCAEYEFRAGDWFASPGMLIGAAAANFTLRGADLGGGTFASVSRYASGFMLTPSLVAGYDFPWLSLYASVSYHAYTAGLTPLNAPYAGLGLRFRFN